MLALQEIDESRMLLVEKVQAGGRMEGGSEADKAERAEER